MTPKHLHYFIPSLATPSSPVGPDFLRLPDHVRDVIYRQAGLFTGALIRIQNLFDLPYSSTPSAESDHEHEPYTVYPQKFDVRVSPTQLDFYRKLRRVSRAVRADAARFLYSNNRLLLRCTHGGELTVLLDAPTHLIAGMRHLTVLLNVSSAPLDGPAPCLSCGKCLYPWHRGQCPLTSTSDKFKALIPDWRSTIDRLVSHANPSKLKLYVTCDVADITTAFIMMAPLKALSLDNCSIRLGDTCDKVLGDLALKTRLQITGATDYGRKPFPFLRLPTEIRHLILSFTHLVSPFREVEWSPSPSAYRLPWAWRRPFPCASREFCNLRHAVSPACDCWRPPTPLFLVCQTMLQDAKTVFYSSNRFIVMPSRFLSMPTGSTSSQPIKSRFEASIFLGNLMSQDALRHLRTLEIIFTASAYNRATWNADAYTDWAQTIKSAAAHTNRLALRLYLGYNDIMMRSAHGVRCAQAELFRIHEQIVKPLAHLDALDYLLVDAESPFDHPVTVWDLIPEQRREHSSRLHRLIMGAKRNNPATARSQQLRSGWLSFPLELPVLRETDDTPAPTVQIQQPVDVYPSLFAISS